MTFNFMLSFLVSIYGSKPAQNGMPFEQAPQSFAVRNSITEASGIASSKINPGYLWVHEDGGNSAQVLLLKKDGTFSKSIPITGAENIDWEDMGLAKGPDAKKDYIYLADIGDNIRLRSSYTIYRFEEPALTANVVKVYDKIRFRYPDGSRDAEAILIDNLSKDIYIVTKSDNPSHLYKITYPQSTTSVNQAILVGKLAFGGVTGAAISIDSKELIIKTYPALNYFSRKQGETIEQALKKPSVTLTYHLEPQGEAVAFASDNSGFYTLSEKGFGSSVKLYFYKRK
jgi:hypothetical protein